MQDIDVIARNNAKAVQDSIPCFLRQGKYVVETREGLHFVGISTHDTLEQAQAAAAEINNPTTGTKATIHTPSYIDPLMKQEQQDAALAQQAVKAAPQITETEAPPPRRNLSYGVVQVVALVVTDGKEVWPLPPHRAAAVLHDNDPKQIVALCGPDTDLPSVQDAVVLSKAYELREALGELLAYFDADELDGLHRHAYDRACVVFDSASPVFASMTRPSHEEKLTELMKGYDPSLTPKDTELTEEQWTAMQNQLNGNHPASMLTGEQLGQIGKTPDTSPSESEPQTA